MALALLVGFGTLLISLLSYGMATALIVHLVVPVLRPGRAGTWFWKDFVVKVMVSLATALVHVMQIVLWATTTPYDMVVLNDLDRFHLVMDVIDRVPQLGPRAAYAKQALRDKLIDHKHYVCKHGDDMPEIAGWRWGQQAKAGGPRVADTGGDNV
jgi:hypothetical protein